MIDQRDSEGVGPGPPSEAFADRRVGRAALEAVAAMRGGGSGTPVGRDLSLELPAGAEAAQGARHALGRLEGRLDQPVIDDLRLLVTELVTNSVRHATTEPAATVTLDVSVARDAVRVEVSDRGSGFSPRPRRAGQDVGSGWGLYLVDRLADRWGVISGEGRSRVWLEIGLSRPAIRRAS